jgi:plastocyanin
VSLVRSKRLWVSCVSRVFAASLLTGASSLAGASTLEVHTYDSAGKAMENVAIAVYPAASVPFDPVTLSDAVVAQQGREFVPYLTVIRTGSRVTFPNRDNMEHHLKSFSATKEFEFKIYSTDTPPPVVFDKPGPVALHCLIHDWMQGFVYVVDTPYFGATDAAGALTLTGLPEGKYEVRAWHPLMGSYLPPLSQTLTLNRTQALRFDFAFLAKKRRAPHPMN